MAKTKYGPDVERRRADYERLAESLALMVEFAMYRAPSGLDLPDAACVTDAETNVLEKALLTHFHSLMTYADFLKPQTVREFYVELRLWGDHMAAQQGESKRN